MIRLTGLAFAIADRSVRSEIELYAKNIADADLGTRFDTSKPSIEEGSSEDWQAIVSDALAYIGLRGEELPYVMHRCGDVVWFVERVQ